MTKITAIIPTLNEEGKIKDALESVKFADEIVVIDSFSSDNTVEIVNNFGAKLIQREFDDFSSQKNYAISHASHDWIIWLDADEVLPENLQKEIREKVNNPENFVGFYIYRIFFFKGNKIRFSGTQNDKLIRLFNKNNCHYRGKVHEKIITDGKLGILKNKMLHYSYNSFDQFINKLNHYGELKAEVLEENKVFITPYHFVIKPIVRFFKHYIIKLGIFDGTRGFVLSCAFAYSVFVRYVKLWQLRQNKK